MGDEGILFEQSPGETAEPPRKTRKRRSIFDDPLVRTLSLVAMGLVALYLLTIASALVMGVIGSEAPDTKVERDVAAYEAQISLAPEDATLWAKYVGALLASGQYVKAQDVIDRGTEAVDQSSSQVLLMMQAQLYHDTERYDEAIETADEVRKLLKTRYDEQKAIEGTPEFKNQPISENFYLVLMVKAESLAATGETEKAIETLDEYLAEKPADAAALVRRGSLKADVGDEAGAEADFRAALNYVPDDATALEGLQKIGAE